MVVAHTTTSIFQASGPMWMAVLFLLIPWLRQSSPLEHILLLRIFTCLLTTVLATDVLLFMSILLYNFGSWECEYEHALHGWWNMKRLRSRDTWSWPIGMPSRAYLHWLWSTIWGFSSSSLPLLFPKHNMTSSVIFHIIYNDGMRLAHICNSSPQLAK